MPPPAFSTLWGKLKEKRKNKWDDFEEREEDLENSEYKRGEDKVLPKTPRPCKKILSILSKTPCVPPLPARGKPKHTLAQKATFDAAHPPQPLATPTKTPTRHTRHARRQAQPPPPLFCRARAPGAFPSRGGFTLNPPLAPRKTGPAPPSARGWRITLPPRMRGKVEAGN